MKTLPHEAGCLGIGVVGCGYWGPNLIRNFYEYPRTRVLKVCDLDEARLDTVKARYPLVETTTSFATLIDDPSLDAVAIATPVDIHYQLAKAALEAGKHVLVEKPLTRSVEEGMDLVETAKRVGRVLMVDHTFVYTEAVRRLHAMIQGGELGKILYYDSQRINLGLIQRDVNVLWDLAVHDLSIIQYLLGKPPQAVSATGMGHVPGKAETIAYLTLHYDSDFIAHIHANWLSPVKVRRILLGGDKKMAVYDDVEPSEKLKIYDAGVVLTGNDTDYRNAMIDYRKGDVWIPHLPVKEALRTEVAHFADCVIDGVSPITGGSAGLSLVRMLEAASKSLFLKGQPIPL